MTKDLADELAQRLQLAKDHGPLSESREVYIPSSWLPALLASLTGEGEPVACPDREAVARIIDPGAFARHVFSGDPDWHPDDDRLRKNNALAKADAVLALLSGGGE